MRIVAAKDLAAAREAAKVEIDRRAGVLRELFFVAAPGQESEYQLKEREALAWLAAPGDPATFPLLASDAAVDGVTPTEAAQAIIAQASIWRQALAVINLMRRGAKKAVDTAASVAAIEAQVATVSLEGLAAHAPELAAAIE